MVEVVAAPSSGSAATTKPGLGRRSPAAAAAESRGEIGRGEIALLFHRFLNKYWTKLNAVFGSWRGKRRPILEARLLFTIINAAPGN